MGRRTWISVAAALVAAPAMMLLSASAFGQGLVVTQVESADPVPEGSSLTYTMTVTHTGGNPANDAQLEVQATKPGDLSPVPNPYLALTVTAGTGQCTVNNPQGFGFTGGQCSFGPMAAGATRTVQGVVQADFSMDHVATTFACAQPKFCFEAGSSTERTTVTHPTPTFTGSKKIKLKGFPSTCATRSFKVKAKAKASKVKSVTASLSGPRDDLGDPLDAFKPPKKLAKKKGKKVKAEVKAGSLPNGFYELTFLAPRKGSPNLKRTATFQVC